MEYYYSIEKMQFKMKRILKLKNNRVTEIGKMWDEEVTAFFLNK